MTVYWPRPAVVSAPLPSRVDVAVIGAGFAGLTVAQDLLATAPGLRLAVLDAHHPGFGASGRNAGSVLPVAMPVWLLRGSAGSYNSRELHLLLHDRVHARMRDLHNAHPAGEVRPVPLVMLGTNRLMAMALDRTADAIEASGMPVARWSGAHATATTTVKAKNAAAVDAWTIQPAMLAAALAEAVTSAGGAVHSGAPVVAVEPTGSGVAVILVGGHRIDADRVVVATGAYTDAIILPDTPKATVKHTYMRASAPLEHAETAALGGPRMFLSAPGQGMPYWRVHEDRLLFGGIDIRGLRPGADADGNARGHRGVDRLQRRLLPGHQAPAELRWGGPMHVTPSETPYVARSAVSDRIVYAVGFAGSGVALTLTCGPLVRDLVLGAAVADPAAVMLRDGIRSTRIPWRGVISFLKPSGASK